MTPSDLSWHPSPERLARAHATRLMSLLGASGVDDLRRRSVADLPAFWNTVIADLDVAWTRPYRQVLDLSGGLPWARWFLDGETNLALNCVDRHAAENRPALLWEGDDGAIRRLSYPEFAAQVNQAARALTALGVQPGDAVGLLMPMVPEVVIQLMACFKVGAIAVPVFSGFGPEAIAERLRQAGAVLLFTSDCSFRRGKRIPVKETADQAAAGIPSLRHMIVVARGDGHCPLLAGRDLTWAEAVLTQSAAPLPSLSLPAEAPALIIFTSGTTGKPKGAIHTHAGCLATIGKELRYAFNVDAAARFFWFTDIGWMMGPWEMIGVTLFGGALFLFEGAPDYPTPGRLWEMIDRHRLTAFGISPTAIRLLMRSGPEVVRPFDLSSLDLLGSTGEPWDPASWHWFFDHVGRRRCPIINISGGTEIIGCLLSPLPIEPLKPCSLGGPALGADLDVFDEDGRSVRGGIGHLVCRQPLPSMTKGFLNDRQRYLDTYFTRFPGVWYHGDWARVDADGQWFLHGRSDDTLKIAGKRVGPVEYEAALLADPRVAEAAAVGLPDDLKGEACLLFAVLKPGHQPSEPLRAELLATVTRALGKALAPRTIRFTTTLPKTRSAKILRGLIRQVALGHTPSDLSSVENPDALRAIAEAI